MQYATEAIAEYQAGILRSNAAAEEQRSQNSKIKALEKIISKLEITLNDAKSKQLEWQNIEDCEDGNIVIIHHGEPTLFRKTTDNNGVIKLFNINDAVYTGFYDPKPMAFPIPANRKQEI